jgi:hypothetical protein
MKSFFDFGYLTLALGHEDFPHNLNKAMQRKIVKYELVSQRAVETLQQKVNQMLQEGWELHGSPWVGTHANGHAVHSQALVKYEATSQFPDDISELAYVTGNTMSELGEKVSERIKEGWRPVGNLVVGPTGNNFYQAMCKTDVTTKL